MAEVRAAMLADHAWIVDAATEVLGDPFQAASHRQFHVTDLDLLVAEVGGERVGFAGWEVDGEVCETLAIGCTRRGEGVGAALMDAVRGIGHAHGCARMRVVTTDENVGAQRFYERLGYALVERRVGAVDECRRRYKPHIPESSHDELVYERALCATIEP